MREEFVEAFRQGDEAQARTLLSQLGQGFRQVRASLAAMLEKPDAHERRAAAFGLGVLGGAASTRLLTQQLAIEEARGDYDGASVAEAITQALGQIKDAGARASLVKRLERLASGAPPVSEVYSLVYALWRQRHPELLPPVMRALRALAPSDASALQGLRILLEKSPEELRVWAGDLDVPLEQKTWVLSVLDEEVPDSLRSVFPVFISVAASVLHQQTEARYEVCLLSVLLSHREQLLAALPEESRTMLRAVALGLVASRDPSCSLRAAVLLQHIGRPEDAAHIEAFRPEEPIIARAFDEAARTLRRNWDA
ncbi:hypothetical protein [Pyxidicoccus xibeiensis]|uniref:hypothetical protein n=1 Tax=Pyxidicoccus xibeiensis TaxID=2906759 RepID=UPI0020A75608|nr:hypothetical protein [Pyxidicoccus xibeiensis]MCP3141662.1 hypothetical protein [Pyxidicoccus xibeiensis]